MGLFGGKKEKKDAFSVTDLAGMRLEVMRRDTEEDLLFVAYADATRDGILSLRQVSAPNDEEDAKLPENLPVSMRGYHEDRKQAVHLDAEISRVNRGNWCARRVEITGMDNDRAFFRQETSNKGELLHIQQEGTETVPCKLLNISAGGACVLTQLKLVPGDQALLQSVVLDGCKLPHILCTVRRVSVRKLGYEYGCEFTDITPATEDAIVRIILEMQRRTIQRTGGL